MEERTIELGYVCDVDYGKRIVQKPGVEAIYPVYGGGGSSFSTDSYNREDCLVIARFSMPKQCAKFIRGKFFLNDNGLTMRSRTDEMRQDYLEWQLLALNDKIYHLGKGSVQRNLDISSLMELRIRIPSIKKQSCIVEELNLIQSIIERKRMLINELDNLSSSTFNEMFGDMRNHRLSDFTKLYYLCDVMGRFNGYARENYVESPEEGVISLSPANIIDNELNFDNCTYISWEQFEHSPMVKVDVGDVILVRKGANIERWAMVKTLPHDATVNQHLILLKNIRSIDPLYLTLYLKSPYARKKYRELAAGASNPTLSHAKLKSLPVYIPPVKQQYLLAERIEAIEKTKHLIRKSLVETEALLNGRMSRYFR